MFEQFRSLFKPSLKLPFIKALQLEVSTVCQLSCIYCPRTQSDQWLDQFMSWELYKERIAPYFNFFEMVFLQGWGEPLTNPHLWDMVELAKSAHCKVGFVTNGILFDENSAERACDLGVDLVSFTFTGSCPDTHEYYRHGASYNALIDTVRMLADKKMSKKTDKPSIGVSFTMMRGNLHEFPSLVEQAIQIGANQVTASHMDCITTQEMEQHTVFLNPLLKDNQYITRAAQIAQTANISFKAEPPRLTGEILACEPNPLRMTLFIRADGTVAPCHQMALSPLAVEHLYYHSSAYEYTPVILGNVKHDPLPVILNNRLSQTIRNIFGSRIDGIVPFGENIPDAPLLCQKCYKLYGG